MTNCKNCGAPLHGNKCEYCGTEYDNKIISVFKIETCNQDLVTLGCQCEIPLEYTRDMSEKEIADIVKKDLSRKMCEEIAEYMDIETWVRPETLSQVFGGRIRVAKPN